jgi:hypothetical protein
MGENHKENLTECLKQWHDMTLRQNEVLAAGDLQQFERLNRVSIVLQSRFRNTISHLAPAKLDNREKRLLEEIQELQAVFIEEIKKGCQEVSRTIGTLRKNRTSLKGYRQGPPRAPRFKSERT